MVKLFLGGKTKEGYPIITFPDTGNFIELSAECYEKLISYITSVPSYVFVHLKLIISIKGCIFYS